MVNTQKRIAADILKVGLDRIKFDQSRLSDIKESITKQDIRALIREGAIKAVPLNTTSKFWVRKNKAQKRKGKRKGQGSRKGKKTARLPKKRAWINRIRLQRKFLKELKDKEKISSAVYRELYLKCKGGFFRSKRHIKLYLEGVAKK